MVRSQADFEQANGHTLRPGSGAAHDRPAAESKQDEPARPKSFRVTRSDDGHVTVTFDRPGMSVNTFDVPCLDELDAVLAQIEAEGASGVLFASAKESVFIAGADLRALTEERPETGLDRMITRGQEVFERIARLPMPTVAAIHGACLGGGYELALACDWRVASDAKATRIGLPETQLGILPAWGGSTRLPRLIGVPAALEHITRGEALVAKRALSRGMIDEVTSPERLVAAARDWLKRGKRRKPAGLWRQNNALAVAIARRVAWARAMDKTRGHYPAIPAAIDVVCRAWRGPIAEGLRLEREAVAALAQTSVCRNLIGLFFAREAAKKVRAPGAPPRSFAAARERKPVLVVGAGVMGAGIAQWSASQGHKIWLRDVDDARVADGLRRVARSVDERVKRKQITAVEGREILDRISPVSGAWRGGHATGVAIEAVVERMEIKRAVLGELERTVPDTALLATNTSALSVTEMAKHLEHPERFVGVHFFNPVEKMPLVEVVMGACTTPETADRALQWVQAMGKVPVLVQDRPGFLVNRVLVPYLLEAGALFDSGVPAEDIDEAMLEFGMPMGPLRLIDEVGADVAWHVAQTLVEAHPDRLRVPACLQRMMDSKALGVKAGRGFYLYDATGRARGVNTALASGAEPRDVTMQSLADRMVFLMINEAAMCVDEGVVASPADADFAMVMGTGFAPFRGGPLRWADASGHSAWIARAAKWEAKHGPMFRPCELWKQVAEQGGTFYGSSLPRRDTPAAPTVTLEPPETLPRDQAKSEPSDRPAPAPAPTAAMQAGTAPGADVDPSAPPADLIDTSRMSEGQRAALEVTEAAREDRGNALGLVAKLFMGQFDPSEWLAVPEQSADDRAAGDRFLRELDAFLREKVDPDQIDRDGEIPDAVIDGLARMGAFGIKVGKEYGGLGLSQTNYCRAAERLGSTCGNLAALLSAHQSIGVPQPLILFGTEAQKQKYLPRVAAGEISAFALTEEGVGSDPAQMKTEAVPTEDGSAFILNGEKLWCTNGTRAGLLVVMAKTPPQVIKGKTRNQITAFIVERDWPGVEVVRRCRFMGLRALYNGVMRFTNVRVPRENIIWGEGKGLKVALTTLNTGRLTLPAACGGLVKRCLDIARTWSAERVQWGQPIGKHGAIADRLATLAQDAFAIEAMTEIAAGLVDQDKHADIRLEAAMAKMWGSERAWAAVDSTMQIRGGRGYETADSLRARGEPPIPVERMMRDCRINLIFEGSSEIMRLFIMREALDPHLRRGGPVIHPKTPLGARLSAVWRAAWFYAGWYPMLWAPSGGSGVRGAAGAALTYVGQASRRLARTLFHQMVWCGPSLEKRQVLLGRMADIGADLFALACVAVRAERLRRRGQAPDGIDLLIETLTARVRTQTDERFRAIASNHDRAQVRVARHLLDGHLDWLTAHAGGHPREGGHSCPPHPGSSGQA